MQKKKKHVTGDVLSPLFSREKEKPRNGLFVQATETKSSDH